MKKLLGSFRNQKSCTYIYLKKNLGPKINFCHIYLNVAALNQ